METLPRIEEAEVIQPGGLPLPADLEGRVEFLHITHEDVKLRVMLAVASDEPRGSIIFSPGRTEFIEKYLETTADFVRRGFNVLIVDPRGQGLSQRLTDDPLKSWVKDFQDYADDFAFAADVFKARLPKPHIAMGHSMGGTIVLQAVISEAFRPSAVVCSAPMLGLHDIETPVLAWSIRIVSALGFSTRNLPYQRQRNGQPIPFNGNKLTSDETRYTAWSKYFQTENRLRVGQPTFGWIVAGLKSMRYVNSNAPKIKIPGLIVAAGADPIVDPASNANFAKKAGIDFAVVPGALHELFLERDEYRNQFFEIFEAFLEKNAL